MMIKHIVAFKLMNPAEAERVKAHLMELDGAIDVIRLWDVGINIGTSSKPYEVVVYSVFDNLGDLEIFRDHAKHIQVKNAIAGYIETSGTIDYESDL